MTYEMTPFIIPISGVLSDVAFYIRSYVFSYVLFDVRNDVVSDVIFFNWEIFIDATFKTVPRDVRAYQLLNYDNTSTQSRNNHKVHF